METTVSVRLGKNFLKDLEIVENKWQADRSEVIRRLLASAVKEWKIQNALENIAAHKTSIGKAAEEINLSIADLIYLIKEKNIDWTDYSDDDLKKDISRLSK